MTTQLQKVKNYYLHPESRLGYSFFTWDTKHFGYYPSGRKNIAEKVAQFKTVDLLAKKLQLKRDDKVLDAGSGRGTTAIYLAKKYGVKVTGIDIVPFELAMARKKASRAQVTPQVNFIEADYSATSFPKQSFDKVFTLETLVHSLNYQKTLKEFYRLLKPNGRLVLFEYISSPKEQFTAGEWQIFQLMCEGSASVSLPKMKHEQFTRDIKKQGFKLIEIGDISRQMLPSAKRFYNLALIPYQLIKLLNWRKHFINTTAGVEFYRLVKKGLIKYRIVVAVKP
jgi:ubiquinone/menaquinone biosynthesis C-methylase UbiE